VIDAYFKYEGVVLGICYMQNIVGSYFAAAKTQKK